MTLKNSNNNMLLTNISLQIPNNFIGLGNTSQNNVELSKPNPDAYSMKKLILLSILSGVTVGCTSTRIDDHSYHHNDAPQRTPPVNIVNNNYINSHPPVTNVNRSVNHYVVPEPPIRPRNVYQEDEEFLQYRQEPQVTPSSYRGLHIRVDRNNRRTIVPDRWDNPRYPSIPPGNEGVPVFYQH